MKRHVLVSSLILMLIVTLAAAEELPYKEGQLIVRFTDTGPQSPIREVMAGPVTTRAIKNTVSNLIASGSDVAREFNRISPDSALIKLPAGMTVEDALSLFGSSGGVLLAEPNYKRKLLFTPNDPDFYLQWGLHNTGQLHVARDRGTPDADIDAPEGWNIQRLAPNVVVAVLDTGIDYTHPQLGINMWVNIAEDEGVDGADDDGNGYIDDIYGYDFAGDSAEDIYDADGDPVDFQYHGTHVAGIIGAAGHDVNAITGVCMRAQLMAMKVFADDGEATVADIASAIGYAINPGSGLNRARVINASFGGPLWSDLEYNAIWAARNRSVLFVAAAGNADNDNDIYGHYPASYPLDNIISVMATDHDDNRASGIGWASNYGETSVDLGAPGKDIYSTLPVEITPAMEDEGLFSMYGTLSGTSTAAPHVSGAAALMWSVYRHPAQGALSYQDVKAMLLYGVDPTLSGLCVSGGRLNLYSSLNMARGGRVLNVTSGITYYTIQSAINFLRPDLGEHELIAERDRWYFENIDFMTKEDFVLRSGIISHPHIKTIYPHITRITGYLNPHARVVRVHRGEGRTAVLKGFSIIDSEGGGVICENGSSPTIADCIISGNKEINGAGIYCTDIDSDPNIRDNTITGNTASNNGGGIYCDLGSTPDIVGNTITNNKTEWQGGGIYCDGTAPTIRGNDIEGNRANYQGAGIHCGNGSNADILNNTIRNNVAASDGGGIGCTDSAPLISNNLIIDNSVDAWDGGGIYLDNSSPEIVNCTITGNSASENGGLGGGLCLYSASEPNVINSIFSDNVHYAIANYYYDDEYFAESDPDVTFCLFHNNSDGDYIDYNDEPYPPVIDVNTGADELNGLADFINNIDGDPMFVTGRLGDYYLSQYDAGQILDPNGNPIDFGDPNTYDDANSPAVDTGSTYADVFGMDIYSTRTDNELDFGIVDIGYHYVDPQPMQLYELTIVIDPNISPLTSGYVTVTDPDGNDVNSPPVNHIANYKQYAQVFIKAQPAEDYRFRGWHQTEDDSKIEMDDEGEIKRIQTNIITMSGHKTVTVDFETIKILLITQILAGESGTISPRKSRYYNRGTIVNLYAEPDNPAHVIIWQGTDDDHSTLRTNTVTMLTDPEIVKVEFYAPRTLYFPGPYSTIQQAIDEAQDRDIIQIAPSDDAYVSTYGYEVHDKAITITSANPDDPDIVARTVLRKEVGADGHSGSAFNISNVGRDMVINGLTLEGWWGFALDGLDADPARDGFYDGWPGHWAIGGAINLWGASPTIKNCIIVDCNIVGGDGGEGVGGADEHPNGGNGGWPGAAYGGGIALWGGNPAIINCTFRNCVVVGGNGGEGGTGSDDPWGFGGRGGGWYYHYLIPSPWEHEGSEWHGYDYSDPFIYTGRGGAIYIAPHSSMTLTGCTFIDNRSFGGFNGICGLDGDPPSLRDEPSINWKIDNFGGAVFVGEHSNVKFLDCRFIDNIGDVNRPLRDPNDEGSNSNNDAFVSYGGAVVIDEGANAIFENCTFNGNLAAVGGALYGVRANPIVVDSSFSGNFAYHGGGIVSIGGTTKIIRSDFFENEAISSAGEGGAISSLGANSLIADCQIMGNDANSSGGGIYISNKNVDGGPVSGGEDILIKNCLIVGNTAKRDGGGISANWNSDPDIVNCTIANNTVSGSGFEAGYGGGLSCSYGNYTEVLNSIIWSNIAAVGDQIAIGTSYKYDPRPSTAEVSYSDVQGGAAAVYVDIGDPNIIGDNGRLIWDYTTNKTGTVGDEDSEPLFETSEDYGGDFYLSQIFAGQDDDSPCVDAGSDTAANLDMYRHTTRTDWVVEIIADPNTIVDMGYHYLRTADIVGDFNFDGVVDWKDLIIFKDHWLESGCDYPDWCYETDLNQDGIVNFYDAALFMLNYGEEETTPPAPNPMMWEDVPYSDSETSIAMTAVKAVDNSGYPVLYYFQRFDANGVLDGFRGWSPERAFTDTGLESGREYGYRVRATDYKHRDPDDPNMPLSIDDFDLRWSDPDDPNRPDPNDYEDPKIGNKTGWSFIGYAIPGGAQGGPAAPAAPSNLVATAVSNTRIDLEWQDNSGNENGFRIERKTGGGPFEDLDVLIPVNGTSYSDTGLSESTAYTYRVYAFNTAGNSGYSNEDSATTTGGEGPEEPSDDFTPPEPVVWEIAPYETGEGFDAYANMTAGEAIDPEDNGVEYYFECYDNPAVNSGWIAERQWTIYVGRTRQGLRFRFKVRDLSPNNNESGWSPVRVSAPLF